MCYAGRMKRTLLTALFAALLLMAGGAMAAGLLAAEPVVAHEVHFSAQGDGHGGGWSVRVDEGKWSGHWPRNRPVVAVLVVFFMLALFSSVYFLPTLLAFGRKMRYRLPLFVVNIFFGWTFIGWVFCMAWAFWPDRDEHNEKAEQA